MPIPKLPSVKDTNLLRRIAANPLLVTYQAGKLESYSLADGSEIPLDTARRLIRRGWVRGNKDGLFDQPQTYYALKG